MANHALLHLLPLLILLLLLPINSALAQGTSNGGIIAVGSSLAATNNANASTAWFSSSGDFAFGFQHIQGSDLFLLSMWYDKIPDKTIVWFPNEATLVPLGSRVQLTADRGLVLSDSRGVEVWRSQPIGNQVANGIMNDTGNFELLRINDSFRMWSTFEHPSDTLLPGQIMEIGEVLYSRTTESNFTMGRFQFRLLSEGNLVLNTRDVTSDFSYHAYYNSSTSDPRNTSNSGYQLIFDETGSMYILRRNGQSTVLTPRIPSPAADYYFRATLNFDGVFTQYYHPRNFTGNPAWTALWWEPDNICNSIIGDLDSGACGYNSICQLQDQGRPTCECPQGYSLVDPNDRHGSCKPNFTLTCDEGGLVSTSNQGSLYDLLQLNGTDWPTGDYLRMDPISNEECRISCLTDCLCAAAVFTGTSCWKKKFPLSNGRRGPGTTTGVFLKYRNGNLTPRSPPLESPGTGKGHGQGSWALVASVLLGSSVFVNVILITATCLGFFLIYRKRVIKFPLTGGNGVEINLRPFSYEELAEATNGFSEELGRGAFAIVYKGVINTTLTSITIAVKKLDKLVQNGDTEFKTEVDAIAQTHHKNLVRLLGFCNEREHRLLVYEYMSNGTLSSYLFADEKPSWKQRTQIALGIARGLCYLHEECNTQIIHCDIKPQNILLDEHYNARISDFGLAKILMMNQSRTHTAIRGTKGYVAPEWFRNTPVTIKVDVYSFGVLLLEIISCRRSVEMNGDEEKAILTDWAWDCFHRGKLEAFVDNDLEVLSDWKTLEMFVMVGIWCIQEDPSLRPTMRSVSQMLEGVIQVTAPPSPSPLSVSS